MTPPLADSGANDKRVIACNYAEATNIAVEGALAYFCYGWTGGGYERVFLLVRSRSGRLVEKWEPIKRLKNFRFKTIPPEHPRYEDDRITEREGSILTELKDACARYSDRVV